MKTFNEIIAEAEDVLWAHVAAQFPDIKTGDFPPGAAVRFTSAIREAVQYWISVNGDFAKSTTFCEAVSYEHPGYCCIVIKTPEVKTYVDDEGAEHADEGRRSSQIHIGETGADIVRLDESLQWWTITESSEPWPSCGEVFPIRATSHQTGGGVMVDGILLANGQYLTITDEAVMIWRREDDWQTDAEPLALFDLTETPE